MRTNPYLPDDEICHAPYPVWSNSTDKPVKWKKISRKDAKQWPWFAAELDRLTKKGNRCHGGVIGPTALKVLQVMINEFLNFSTGRCDPSIKGIANRANLSPSAVHEALKRLAGLGILTWLRRCRDYWQDGRYVREQLTNAYNFNPPQLWRTGIRVPDGPPPPLPETYRAPYMPNVIDTAAMDSKAGGSMQQVIQTLELAPVRGVEAALALLGRAMLGRAENPRQTPDSTRT
jgi:AraC-like DNA-binding protein